MSDPNSPQDPFAAGRQPGQPGSSNQPPPPPGGQPPPYGSQPPAYGSPQPPPYGSQPPAYGSPPPPPYGSQPRAYGSQPQPGDYYGQPAYGYPKNSLGVWSLVLGIVGIVLSCGLFAGIPAIITGHLARKAVAQGQANNGGMATAGIVLGWIATIGMVLLIIALIAFLPSGNWSDWEYLMDSANVRG